MTGAKPDDSAVAAAILATAAAQGAAKSITPEDAARALAAEWRPLLGPVRRVAAALARDGRIEILRKGKPVDPAEMRGVIRLRIRTPAPDEATP